MASKRRENETPSPSTTVPGGSGSKLTDEQKAFLAALGQNAGSDTGLPTDYQPPKRYFKSPFTGEMLEYGGNQLINVSTGKLRELYSYQDDALPIISEYLKKGPAELRRFLQKLERLNFYQGQEIGNGTSTADIAAVSRFLLRANVEGLDQESAIVFLQSNIPQAFPSSKASGPYRLTNPADLKRAFQSVSQSVIGRGLSDEDVERMVKTYQTLEAKAGSAAASAESGGVTGAPSVETFATDRIKQRFKGEAEDFRAMSVADSMLDAIRSV